MNPNKLTSSMWLPCLMRKPYVHLIAGGLLFGLSFSCVAKGKETYAYQVPVPDGYIQIAKEKNIPSSILYSIAMQESNAKTSKNRYMPWPWTANIYGVGYRFNSREDLYEFCKRKIAKGITVVDIGAGQVDWKYHKNRFNNDLWSATDPAVNLRVSATILHDLYEEEKEIKGKNANWWIVVGKYHSPANGWRAQNYRQSVYNKWRKLQVTPTKDQNSYQTAER